MRKLTTQIWFDGLMIAGLMVAAAGEAYGHDKEPRWNGFMTSSVEASDKDVGYRGTITKTPNWSRNTRAGLNVSTAVADNLDVVIQAVAVAESAEQLRSTLMLLNYRPMESLSLRLGRQQLPLWLMSDYLYVGHAMPWTSAPDEVYGANPLDSLDGANVAYSHNLGSMLFLTEFYGGSSLRTTGAGTLRTAVDARDLMGVTLAISSPLFTARAGYAKADVGIESEAFKVNMRSSYLNYGLRMDYRGIVLLGEYAKYMEKRDADEEQNAAMAYQAAAARVQQTGAFEDKIAFQKAAAAYSASQSSLAVAYGWYAMGGYRFGAWMPHLTHAVWKPAKDSFSLSPQSSNTLGVRYDLNTNTALKVNCKQVTKQEDEFGFFTATEASATKTFTKASIYSASLDVVF